MSDPAAGLAPARVPLQGRARRFVLAGAGVLAVVGMCYHPSHLPAQVSDAEYEVYRAFLLSHPPPEGHRLVVQDHTDDGQVQLCPHLMKSDNNLLWNLIRNGSKTFPVDSQRLGAFREAHEAAAYRLVKFTRVALAGGSAVGVLQVATTDCDQGCAPERREVFTAARSGGTWVFRAPGCVHVANRH